MAKTASLPALGYLAHPEKHPARPVCALFGDEPFLKLRVTTQLRRQVLAGDDGEFSYRTFIGEEIEDPRAVFDELGTVALFGSGQRLVVVNGADPFVTENRATLEDYVARPKSTGVLVLEVRSWPSNTRLYKAIAEHGLSIDCSTPSPGEVLKWMRTWASDEHQATLEPAAAERLLEMFGPQMGRLDQEIAKLALMATSTALPGSKSPPELHIGQLADSGRAPITRELVMANVGGWQVRETWDMIQAATEGRAREALVMLDRLLAAGEEPIGLLAMLASKLRPLAAATRTLEDAEGAGRRISLRQAITESSAKVWPAMLDQTQRIMQQLGRRRTRQLYGWLLEADLALKGERSQRDKSRLVIEELIVKLGQPLGPLGAS